MGASFFLMLAYFFINYFYVSNDAKEQKITRQTVQKPLSQNGGKTNNVISSKKEEVLSKNHDAYPKDNKITQSSTYLLSDDDVEMKVNGFDITFTKQGGCIGKNILSDYFHIEGLNKVPVSIITKFDTCKALGFKVGYDDLRNAPSQLIKNSDKSLIIIQRNPVYELKRVLNFKDMSRFSGDFTLTVTNISKHPANTPIEFELGASSDDKNSGGIFSSHFGEFNEISFMLDDDVQRESLPFESDPSRKTLLEKQRVLPKWIGADSLYWMFALLPKSSQAMDLSILRTGFNLKANKTAEVTQTAYEAWVRQPIQNLLPGESLEFNYKLFFGPKDENILNDYKGSELSESIDYGFFKIIAKPLYKTLSYINGLVKNWGFSIILLTILINIILLPLQIKAYRAAKQMQKIQPEMKKIQEKYKGDRQKLQQETMALMSKNRVNPMSGCLPLLPQIPVFFALNSCLMHTFELRQAPFIFWLKDLSAHDPYFLLPIIMAFLMILYQKMMPMPATDPTQAKIMKVLPIVFSVFMVFYPSGLALYVITNTFISMVRQLFLNRKYK